MYYNKSTAKLFIFSGNAKENTQKMHICSKKTANMHFYDNNYAS